MYEQLYSKIRRYLNHYFWQLFFDMCRNGWRGNTLVLRARYAKYKDKDGFQGLAKDILRYEKDDS